MPSTENNDILERLRHPERTKESRRQITRNLFIRNILNSIFILIALIAMIGILIDKAHLMIWYAIGLFSVIIKMVEVMLRMPGIKNK